MNDRFHSLILDACGNRALQRGEGARAQARATEHTEVAPMNMRLALERRAESEQVMPGIRLVVG